MRRGTLRRNASAQSNRSSLTSLSVSGGGGGGGRKVVEMPKAPPLPLRPKAKDENAKEKPSEEVWQQTWL